MGLKRYLNFDLALERTEAGYRAHLLDSPAGQAAYPFALDLASAPLGPLLKEFGGTSPNAPAGAATGADELQTLGKRLFDSIFGGDLRVAYISSLQLASNQGKGLRIRLRLNDVPELAALPWELLHDRQDFLTLSTQCVLVRFLELPQPISALAVTPPLRVLALISNPSDYPPLDLAREFQQLNDAVVESRNPGFLTVETLEPASVAALQPRLRSGEYHILHFSGHGEFDERAEDTVKGKIVLKREDGTGQPVDAVTLGRLLRDHTSLRLVILNACEGARASTRNAFAGMAQSLIRQGIPAVIAMQFPMTDDAAQIFSRTLYGALGDGFPIDAAVGEARIAIAAQQSTPEWATPVLFTRTDDGQLFDLTLVDEAKRLQVNSAKLAELGADAFKRQDYARAEKYAVRLLDLDPNSSLGQSLSEQVRRERDLAQLYVQAKNFLDKGDWNKALELFQQLQWVRVNYRDVPTLVANAKRALQSSATPVATFAPGAPLASSAPDPNENYYKSIVKELFKGRLVPFLGLGANLYGRAPDQDWQPDQAAPSGEEMARHLAKSFDYDGSDVNDLVRVSEYISVMRTTAELYEELHSLLGRDHKPTPLHRFCAEMPALLRSRAKLELYPILVTANYDDLLEQALRDAAEPFDQLIYLAEGADRGRFLHRTFEGIETIVKNPSSYANMQLDRRTTVIKIHGAVYRADPERDSYVITEDHYLDYLQANVTSLFPRDVAARLKEASVLFMGCNLRNWNLRGLLRYLANPNRRPWVIHPQATEVDKQFWRKLDVYVLDIPLEEFVPDLAARAQEPVAGAIQ